MGITTVTRGRCRELSDGAALWEFGLHVPLGTHAPSFMIPPPSGARASFTRATGRSSGLTHRAL